MSSNNILEPLVDSLIGATGLLFKAAYMGFDTLGNIMYRIIEGKPFETSTEELEEGVVIDNIVKYKFIPVDSFININKNNKLIRYEYIEGEKEGVKACIGCDMEGNYKWLDMLDGHLLVGGATDWGKSSVINVFLTSIMQNYTTNEVILGGCDPKASDIYYFRQFKHFESVGVSTDIDGFIKQMGALKREMDRRAEILENANCRNVKKYNEVSEDKLPYIVFIIDELPQIMANEKCKKELHLIMAKARSYGAYFILITQDGTKESIGKCKMNCNQVIGFHTKDATDSNTLINDDRLYKIKDKGRCYFTNGKEDFVETQIFFIEEEEMEDILSKYKKVE